MASFNEPVDNLICLPSFAEIAFATTQMSRFVFWFQTRNRINRHALTCGSDQVSNCWSHSKCHACWPFEAMQTQQSTGLQCCTTSPNLVLLTKTSRLNSFTLCTSLAKQYDVLRSQSSRMFTYLHVCSGSSVQPLVQRRQCSDLVARLRRTLRPPERCETLSCWTAAAGPAQKMLNFNVSTRRFVCLSTAKHERCDKRCGKTMQTNANHTSLHVRKS